MKSSLVKGQRNTVCWIGEVQPELFDDACKVSVTYRDGFYPVLKILSDDVGKFPKHIYPENALCLYHPHDDYRWKMNEFISSKIIPLTISWIVKREIWKKTETWNEDEFPHGELFQMVGAL